MISDAKFDMKPMKAKVDTKPDAKTAQLAKPLDSKGVESKKVTMPAKPMPVAKPAMTAKPAVGSR